MKTDTAERELGAQVAERVMGWPIVEPRHGDHDWLDDPANYPHLTEVDGDLLLWRDPGADAERWEPSKRIAQAWEVFERLAARRAEVGGGIGLQIHVDGTVAVYAASAAEDSWAESAPLAICRAALNAVERREADAERPCTD